MLSYEGHTNTERNRSQVDIRQRRNTKDITAANVDGERYNITKEIIRHMEVRMSEHPFATNDNAFASYSSVNSIDH
ncbi:hypothetical protein DPMN_084335 [Dreissena polymorpha]|uniref:Uncharacterized protein n=1 Tax=Dreissena polymorpha TaxID=45954 RepID=A0A9D3YE52_DREPO|nr:hypothetical protein DPMN_084335 [Dreissena polymorpha]